MGEIGTGYAGVDEALGGVIVGDNVVWVVEDESVYERIVDTFVDIGAAGRRGLFVDFGGFGTRADRIDATSGGTYRLPGPLLDELERRVRDQAPDYVVIDGLGRVARRWGVDATSQFFAHACPAMLDLGVTAYWSFDSGLGRPFLDHARQITQCMLDVREGRLRVLKAEGRPDALQDITYQVRVTDGDVVIESPPAGGRLARGLGAVRQQFGLTQQELASLAGVTPSAISQAEGGARGLSLETVVRIADRLHVTVDRLLSTGRDRTYTLSRHDRVLRTSTDGVTALASDSTVGLRSYLVDLGPGEVTSPPFDHRGVSVVAPLRGLIQVELDDDRPVLRVGDVLVVERGGVRSWRNLRNQPARTHWILRD
ncbi:MAG: helix-turn-helix domain-containing protein [Ilumatobacter sp.]|nr:helix-turn-helix domain-containing protein [Ilumatobacter sp.]